MFGYPKVKLFTAPTPLQRLENLSADLGINLYMKRDDMACDLGLGGNKLRKLEYLVADAQAKGATLLLTYGGAQTNHGRLTAAAAAKQGLRCAILALDEHPAEMNANLLLDRLMGAEVFIIQPNGTPGQLERAAAQIRARYAAEGEVIYEIPVGGSNVLGALGYMDCGAELAAQMQAANIAGTPVYCAAGSLGTFLGLWTGLRLAGSPSETVGIAISPFGPEKEARLLEYYEQLKEAYRLPFEGIGRRDFHLETAYVREGYNVPNPLVREAIYAMASREGILLDPCYTGKMFAGVLEMLREGKIKRGSTLTLLHTGGVPGLYTPFHRAAMEPELLSGYHLI